MPFLTAADGPVKAWDQPEKMGKYDCGNARRGFAARLSHFHITCDLSCI